MSITAQEVNKLRSMTGAGMMDCKKALTESEGDFEKAIDFLRKKGQKVSAARSDKEASEGAVFMKTNAAGDEGIVIALNCETDFVAKTDDFLKLGNSILAAAESKKPKTIEELHSVSAADGRPLKDHITDLIGKIGEKVEISKYEIIKGEKVITYVHGSKLGVLVALKGTSGKDVSEVGKM
jgi:elongation factor Ts